MGDARTFAVAVKQEGDIVVAADGRMAFHDGRASAECVLKTARLNDSLCVALSGDTPYMLPVLETLGLPTKGIPHDRLLQDWEESREEPRIGYGKAKRRIMAALPGVISLAQKRGELDELVGILLIGKRSTGPVMCNWGSIVESLESGDDPCKPRDEALARYSGHLFIGRIPSESTNKRARLM